MHLRSLLTGNTRWALSQVMAAALRNDGMERSPGLSSAALCPACDTHPWNHLNRHSFFFSPESFLVLPWLSFSFRASLFIKSFFLLIVCKQNKKKPETSLILSYRNNCFEVGFIVYFGFCLIFVTQVVLYSGPASEHWVISMCHLACFIWCWESTLPTELLHQHPEKPLIEPQVFCNHMCCVTFLRHPC